MIHLFIELTSRHYISIISYLLKFSGFMLLHDSSKYWDDESSEISSSFTVVVDIGYILYFKPNSYGVEELQVVGNVTKAFSKNLEEIS